MAESVFCGAGRDTKVGINLHNSTEYLEAQYAAFKLRACPLMHGTGMWLACFVHMFVGSAAVLTPKLGLDPDLLWSLVERHRATDIVIVGDAFAKPRLPRRIVFVDRVRRAPNGKADYKWAKGAALAEA